MLHANEHMNAYEALLYVQNSKYNCLTTASGQWLVLRISSVTKVTIGLTASFQNSVRICYCCE